jgi:hypothetical protein
MVVNPPPTSQIWGKKKKNIVIIYIQIIISFHHIKLIVSSHQIKLFLLYKIYGLKASVSLKEGKL